jgi:hypothetical protein
MGALLAVRELLVDGVLQLLQSHGIQRLSHSLLPQLILDGRWSGFLAHGVAASFAFPLFIVALPRSGLWRLRVSRRRRRDAGWFALQ